MTKIVKGPDPLPGSALTKHTWKSIRAGHEVVWLGSDRTLFWHRASGDFAVYLYTPSAPVESDPYVTPATTQGSWSKKGITEGHRLLYLGNGHRRLLEWAPTGKGTAHYRLWLCEPTAKNVDPLIGNPRAEGDWTKDRGVDTRFVYLGGDLVLTWTPDDATHTFIYNVYRFSKDPGPKGDPLSFLANGAWGTIGADHELHYLGNDRMLVWRPKDGHYRVYRVDRTVKNWSQLLPDPVLAEGQWESIKDEADGSRHRLAFMPGGGGRVIDWVPPTGAVRVWAVNNAIPELPEDTAEPGVQLKRKGAEKLLLVDIPQAFKKGPAGPTVSEVASQLRLPPPTVFDDVLNRPENDHAVRALYELTFGGTAPARPTSVKKLRAHGYKPAHVQSGKYVYTVKEPYRSFHLGAPEGGVLFTLSDGYKDVLKNAAAEQARQARIAATKPTFESLRQRVNKIELEMKMLEHHTNSLRQVVSDAMKEGALLGAMEQLLGLMLRAPKEGADDFDADDRKEVEGLRTLMRTLIDEHNKHTVLDPAYAQDFKQFRDKSADALLALIKDGALLAESRVLSANLDIADPDLVQFVYDTCLSTYTLLSLSQHGETIVEKHARPLLDRLTVGFDPTGLPKTGKASFDAELVATIAAPPDDTWVATLAKYSGPIPNFVGNTPGPASLAVGVLQLAAPLILANVLKSPAISGQQAARIFKVICNLGKFDAAQRALAAQAVGQGNLKGLMKIDWSGKFQASPAWAGAIGLMNAAAFFAAVEANDESTLRAWANIAGSYTGTSAAVVQLGESMANAFNLMRLAGGLNYAGRALGAVGGFAACIAGAVTAVEELDSGDRVGFFLAAAGSAAGAMSAVGFLMAGGLAMTATGGGAPVGVALMLAGAVIGVGVGVSSLVRDQLSAKTHGIFEACLKAYGREDGPITAFRRAHPTRESLKKAYEAVKTAHHPGFVGFMAHVQPTTFPGEKWGGIEFLYDLGFQPPTVAACVDMDPHPVTIQLIKTRKHGV